MIDSHLLALIPIHSLRMAHSSRNELVKPKADLSSSDLEKKASSLSDCSQYGWPRLNFMPVVFLLMLHGAEGLLSIPSSSLSECIGPCSVISLADLVLYASKLSVPCHSCFYWNNVTSETRWLCRHTVSVNSCHGFVRCLHDLTYLASLMWHELQQYKRYLLAWWLYFFGQLITSSF